MPARPCRPSRKRIMNCDNVPVGFIGELHFISDLFGLPRRNCGEQFQGMTGITCSPVPLLCRLVVDIIASRGNVSVRHNTCDCVGRVLLKSGDFELFLAWAARTPTGGFEHLQISSGS